MGALCTNQTAAQISPDGMWVAATCRGQDGVLDSHLRVVSIQDTRDWTIKFGDYADGITYDRNNMIVPFRWSIDGGYLYASSPSKASGGCWLGTEVLLVQLNLQTGEQIALLNVNEERYPAIYFTVSTNDRFLLYITPIDNDLVIQDLSTGQTRKIELEFPNIVDVGFIAMSEDINKLVLALLESETGVLDR